MSADPVPSQSPRTLAKACLIAGLLSVMASASSLAADAPAAAAKPAKPSLESLVQAKGYQLGKEVESVPDYRVEGWTSVDRRHLIFSAGPATSYLLTLQFDCPDLSFSDTVGFTTTTSELTKLDSVKVATPGSDIPRTCPISTINQLSKIPKPPKK